MKSKQIARGDTNKSWLQYIDNQTKEQSKIKEKIIFKKKIIKYMEEKDESMGFRRILEREKDETEDNNEYTFICLKEASKDKNGSIVLYTKIFFYEDSNHDNIKIELFRMGHVDLKFFNKYKVFQKERDGKPITRNEDYDIILQNNLDNQNDPNYRKYPLRPLEEIYSPVPEVEEYIYSLREYETLQDILIFVNIQRGFLNRKTNEYTKQSITFYIKNEPKDFRNLSMKKNLEMIDPTNPNKSLWDFFMREINTESIECSIFTFSENKYTPTSFRKQLEFLEEMKKSKKKILEEKEELELLTKQLESNSL